MVKPPSPERDDSQTVSWFSETLIVSVLPLLIVDEPNVTEVNPPTSIVESAATVNVFVVTNAPFSPAGVTISFPTYHLVAKY